MDSTGESSGSSFVDWVVENGGDVELVDLLKANGFMSKNRQNCCQKVSQVLPIFICTVYTNHKR